MRKRFGDHAQDDDGSPSARLAMAPLLGGCVAHAAYDVATLPVRAGSKVVDWSTTSRSEADRNLGRKVRKQREQEAREARRQEAGSRRRRRGATASLRRNKRILRPADNLIRRRAMIPPVAAPSGSRDGAPYLRVVASCLRRPLLAPRNQGKSIDGDQGLRRACRRTPPRSPSISSVGRPVRTMSRSRLRIVACAIRTFIRSAANGTARFTPASPATRSSGHVTAVGDHVTAFKVGETVGVGCMVDSCQNCASLRRRPRATIAPAAASSAPITGRPTRQARPYARRLFREDRGQATSSC